MLDMLIKCCCTNAGGRSSTSEEGWPHARAARPGSSLAPRNARTRTRGDAPALPTRSDQQVASPPPSTWPRIGRWPTPHPPRAAPTRWITDGCVTFRPPEAWGCSRDRVAEPAYGLLSWTRACAPYAERPTGGVTGRLGLASPTVMRLTGSCHIVCQCLRVSCEVTAWRVRLLV